MTLALIAALLVTPADAADADVYLATVGPGEPVWSLYGHAAIVVRMPKAKMSNARVYNFGITQWPRPNYVRDFLTGRVKYWGARAAFGKNVARWRGEDRDVLLYPLNLDGPAKVALVKRMQRDIQPEHREYTYDTFRENCATRLRDYLDTYTGGAVYAALGEEPTGRSYRDDVRAAYSGALGLLLMTEIVPGESLDAPRTAWEMGYRPVYLGESLREVTLPDGRPLTGEPEVFHTRAGPPTTEGWPHLGQAALLALAGLVALLGWWLGGQGARLRGVGLALASAVSTLLGVVLLGVALITDWPDMQQNWLVLCFVPLDLLLWWSAGRLLWSGRAAGGVARAWLGARGAVVLVVLLAGVLGIVAGPLPPRVLALAGIWLGWRCLGSPAGGAVGNVSPQSPALA